MGTPTLEELHAFAGRFNQYEFLLPLGMKVSFPAVDRIRVSIDEVTKRHLGGLGTSAVNGTVISAVFDLSVGMTAVLQDPSRRSATVNLSTTFERPTFGKRIWADAWIQHGTKTTLFSASELYDEAGTVCARCTGLVRLASVKFARGTPGV